MLTVFNPACNAHVKIRREGPEAIGVRDAYTHPYDNLESERDKGARREKSPQGLCEVVSYIKFRVRYISFSK